MVSVIWQSIVTELIHFVLQTSIDGTQTAALSTGYVYTAVCWSAIDDRVCYYGTTL